MEQVTSHNYTGPRPGSPEQVLPIIDELHRFYPDATCSLNFSNPLQLLIATQLAAQCTDKVVNIVTEKLFVKYPTVEAFATVSQEELEQDIHRTGFYKNKAKNIRATCQRIITEYGGEVPQNMKDLLTLPGVARKTANVVLGYAFGITEGVVVDTHVGRITRLLGWTSNTDPVKVEKDLTQIIPKPEWLNISHLLIYHGRAICIARRPQCEQCQLNQLCPSAFAPVPAKTK
ncbi:MAG TPA: endonuclease III [Ktedonobacteraceae bacterium]|nr:endonuclease III [Ktedonobacteraceae bacterium]